MQRELILKQQQTRSQKTLKVRIGVPRRTGRGREAMCPIVIKGVIGLVADIHGVDSMQAIYHALAFTDSVIKNLAPTGKLSWPNGEPYVVEEPTAK